MRRIREARAARVALYLCVLAFIPQVYADFVANLNDLYYWGSGSKRAVFVVDWADGKDNATLAWGYRWEGEAQVFDMFTDLVTGDPRFFARLDSDAGWGAYIFGIGYQNGVTDFDVTGTVDDNGDPVSSNFVNGVWDIRTGSYWEAPSAFNGQPLNPGDHYIEGYGWSFYLGEPTDENVDYPGTYFQAAPTHTYPAWWGASTLGVSDMSLIDEGWYAFTHSGEAPGPAVAAIPEPVGALLLVVGVGVVSLVRRRKTLS